MTILINSKNNTNTYPKCKIENENHIFYTWADIRKIIGCSSPIHCMSEITLFHKLEK